MSRENTLILLGALTALAPFSGLPSSWLEIIFPILGVAIAAIGFGYRREKNPRHTEEESSAVAIDTAPSYL